MSSPRLDISPLPEFAFQNEPFPINVRAIDLPDIFSTSYSLRFDAFNSVTKQPQTINVVTSDPRLQGGQAITYVSLSDVASYDRALQCVEETVIEVTVFKNTSNFQQNEIVTSAKSTNVRCVRYQINIQEENKQKYIFYKDAGGKDKGIELSVKIQDHTNQQVDLGVIPITISLLYENGDRVQDQRILQLADDANALYILGTEKKVLKFRINQVSSKHCNQAFVIQISADYSTNAQNASIRPARSIPVEVKSKIKRSIGEIQVAEKLTELHHHHHHHPQQTQQAQQLPTVHVPAVTPVLAPTITHFPAAIRESEQALSNIIRTSGLDIQNLLPEVDNFFTAIENIRELLTLCLDRLNHQIRWTAAGYYQLDVSSTNEQSISSTDYPPTKKRELLYSFQNPNAIIDEINRIYQSKVLQQMEVIDKNKTLWREYLRRAVEENYSNNNNSSSSTNTKSSSQYLTANNSSNSSNSSSQYHSSNNTTGFMQENHQKAATTVATIIHPSPATANNSSLSTALTSSININTGGNSTNASHQHSLDDSSRLSQLDNHNQGYIQTTPITTDSHHHHPSSHLQQLSQHWSSTRNYSSHHHHHHHHQQQQQQHLHQPHHQHHQHSTLSSSSSSSSTYGMNQSYRPLPVSSITTTTGNADTGQLHSSNLSSQQSMGKSRQNSMVAEDDVTLTLTQMRASSFHNFS